MQVSESPSSPHPDLPPDIITIDRRHPRWPIRLMELRRPPPCLHLRGDPALFALPGVAVVGARHASAAGVEIARRLGRDLAGEGYAVISGMARGIDSAAHRGALDAGGATIAVLGCGVDVCYPADSRDVYARLPREGLLVSEFDHGAGPLRGHFPQRNRIIAALAQAVVVVEGGHRSGSRITADLALELDREVLAVPRDPLTPGSAMPNRLIQAGAAPATGVHDVLAALGDIRPEAGLDDRLPHPALAAPDRLRWLTEVLETHPLGVEELVRASRRPVADVLSALLDLELRGVVERLPGGLFRRLGRG